MEKTSETPSTKPVPKNLDETQHKASATTEIDPEPTKMKSATNVWMVVAVVLLLLLLAAGAVLAYVFVIKPKQSSVALPLTSSAPITSPTTVVAPTWQTYTNVKRAYSVNYPSDWRVREFTESDGAAFSPLSKANDPANETITVTVARRLTDNPNLSFEDYVKIAATSEIQNYTKLASIKKIVTDDEVTGYETTWNIQPLMGQSGGTGVSLPITYFALPNNTTATLQISLSSSEDLATYEQMLKTVKFSTKEAAPTVTPAVDDANLIKDALYKAYNWPTSEQVDVKINTDDGKYASGTASNGYFYAEKVNGTWEIVAAGNGVITCASVNKYPDFPKSLISECYDETTQNSVKR